MKSNKVVYLVLGNREIDVDWTMGSDIFIALLPINDSHVSTLDKDNYGTHQLDKGENELEETKRV